ncbi:hypothetical protein K458DRAFT_490599 [Lentithecium fluviatile CBS 122367]|uniref:Uncharacterized protein n=1 Tax=Lentithecium fluviatile CBS 122367 TaxID=1168545 RepID=A0A6G1IN46_9PLEO|nr:hypothetical protein K458DRAFT_490599 [Lentithecium fluviatile CBS 122367]
MSFGFSDGQTLRAWRGGKGVSSRLIVQDQGFLDVTELDILRVIVLDANGSKLWHKWDQGRVLGPEIPSSEFTAQARILELDLDLPGDGEFTQRLHAAKPGMFLAPHKILVVTDWNEGSDTYGTLGSSTSGRLKPLPKIFQDDIEFIDSMIKDHHVPYRNIPDGRGKSEEMIKSLGKRLFPFTTHSFELAMCVYDWMTASFTHMVFLKIFEYSTYSGIGQPPTPVDQHSIAEQIWKSNWPLYTAQDPDFMYSFMMKPSWSQLEVELQLMENRAMLLHFSNVENRLLAAAMEALPRTSALKSPRLFIGQVDIYQLGRDHFGIEFLEYPGNKGPISELLISDFNAAISTYISRSSIIITKMVWSFTDSVDDSMHYSNGILLVADFPEDSWVWENAAYITPLSDDPQKIEYTFLPGSQFKVKSVEKGEYNKKRIDVITLQIQPRKRAVTGPAVPDEAREVLPKQLETGEALAIVHTCPTAPVLPHSRGRTGGRRCDCIGD